MKTPLLGCASILLALAACSVTNKGITPVSPLVNYNFRDAVNEAESLQPTLSWQDTGKDAESYDLVIHSGILKPQGGYRGFWTPGREVYKRDSIKGTSHRVENALEPDSVYVWAVRKQTKDGVQPWSSYSVERIGGAKEYGLWWRFKTPKQ